MAYRPPAMAREPEPETPPPFHDPAFADQMPVRYWPKWVESAHNDCFDTVTASRPWVDDWGEFWIMVILEGLPAWVPLFKVARLPVDPDKDGPRHMVRLKPWFPKTK
jgi:hypothetical protein